MPEKKGISVRPIRVADFEFIRELASEQPNFTIPPVYVLWLLCKIKGDICLLAETEAGEPLGYLLSVPLTNPVSSLFVWQLASKHPIAASSAVRILVQQLKALCLEVGFKTIYFSAVPDSAAFRALRRYIKDIFSVDPVSTGVLHEMVAPGETEFRLDVN